MYVTNRLSQMFSLDHILNLLSFNQKINRKDQFAILINVLFIVAGVVFIIHDFFMDYLADGHWAMGSIRQVEILVFGILNLFLIKKQQFIIAKIITGLVLSVVLFITPIFITVDYQEMYYLNTLILSLNIFIPLILFKVTEHKQLVFMISVVTLAINFISEYFIFDRNNNASSTFSIFYKEHFVVLSLAKLVTWSFFYIVATHLFEKNELYEAAIVKKNRQLKKYNKLIEDQKSEIEAQNEELRQTQEELSMINENLEKIIHERTREIENKNQRLIEYAYINSHILRSPVARIKGLILLIEIAKTAEDREEYMRYMNVTVSELDDVIASITQILNNEDQEKVNEIQNRVRKLYSSL